MNTALLELNSYTQALRIFINGTQPSAYSELSNFTYSHILTDPTKVLSAVAREINDDYDLLVTANAYEYSLIEKAAGSDDYVASCRPVPASVALSSQERAERLGSLLPAARFTVRVAGNAVLPDEINYGSIRIVFTRDMAAGADLTVSENTAELMISACETHLINPAIGKAVLAQRNRTKEIKICRHVSPILTAELPRTMEVGSRIPIEVSAYPEQPAQPKITVKSSNAGVVSPEGTVLAANNTGIATVYLLAAGENQPFSSQVIEVTSAILIAHIEFDGLHRTQHEGDTVPLRVKAFPEDADDINNIQFESSNPAVAKVDGQSLVLVSAGECEVTARASSAICRQRITVQAKGTQMTLSRKDVSLNVGQKASIQVSFFPAEAYNKHYNWESSDKTVAVVIEEDGKEYIKGVGIGDCEIICRSQDGALADRCSVHIKSILYGEKKKRLPIFKYIQAAILLWLLLSFLNTVIDCFQIATYTPQSTDPDSGRVSLVSESALGEMIATAEEKILSSAYVEDPYWSETKWQPVSTDYVGYFVSKLYSGYYLFVVHEVEVVNPEATVPKTMYTTFRFEGAGRENAVFSEYEVSYSEPSWHVSLYDWLDDYTDNDHICESSLSEDELYSLFGWNAYVDAAEDISADDMAILIDACIDEGDLYGHVAAVESVQLHVSKDLYNEHRNTLYIYLRKDNVNPETGTVTSYYFPFSVDDLKLAENETGQIRINTEDIDIEQYDYVMNLEDCQFYGLDYLIDIESSYSGLKRYAAAEDISVEALDDIVAEFVNYQSQENAEDGYFNFSDIEVAGVYFAEPKEDFWARHTNALYIVIAYDRFIGDELNFHMVTSLAFSDIMADEQGNVELVYDDGTIESDYATIDEYLADIEENYTVTSLMENSINAD